MDLLGGYGSEDSEASSSSDTGPARKPEPAPVAAAASQPSKPNKSRVGKRIVSLHAVLPAAIRDRLTKNINDSDSSSDEEVQGKPAAASGTNSSQHRRSTTKDAGLSMFLSELQSTTLSHSETGKDEGPMGLSLVSAKTTVVRGGVEEEEEEQDTKMPAASSLHPVTASIPSSETPAENRKNAAAVSVPSVAAAPVSLSRVRQAAPPVAAAPLHASQTPAAAPVASLPLRKYPQASEPRNDGAPKSKKRQRQELEKALREGQLNAVDSQATMLEAQDYSHAVLAQQQQLPSTQHGVKKGSIKLYDAHQGTDVLHSQVSAKHRSKHQINQLMASAINLEAQRAREAGLVKRTSSNRADAKRKYGW